MVSAIATPPRRERVRHKPVTVTLLAAMLVVHNAQRMGVVSLFAPLRSRFGTDYGGVGALFAAYVLGYALFQTVVGLVGDRFNAKHLLLTGLLLATGLSALFAWTRSYQLALVARFLLGATGAFLYTPAIKLGITLFAREERGRVLGVVQAGAGLGIVGALVLVPLGVRWLGLTGGFLTLSGFTAAMLVLALVALPDTPQRGPVTAGGGGAALGRRADFWHLLLFSFTGMLAGYGLLTWLPTYLTQVFGYSPVRAGTVASLANVVLLVAAPLVGLLADLPHGRVGVLLGGAGLALLCFLLLVPAPPIAVVLGSTLLLGVSLAATTAPLMLFAGERFGPGETARAVGLLSMAAQLGATLAGVVFGALLARGERFQLIWLVCALLAGTRLAIFASLLLRDRLLTGTRQPLKRGA